MTHVPWLAPEVAAGYAESVFMLAAGMFPFSTTTDPVRTAMAELNSPTRTSASPAGCELPW